MLSRILRQLIFVCGLCLGLSGHRSVEAATFTVTKTADTADGVCDADCSLREAVVVANTLAGADTIVIPAGVYTLTIAGRGEDAGVSGDFDVKDDLTINGANARTTIIDGGGLDRLFDFGNATNSRLSGVTIRNGNPGGSFTDRGGGITNRNTTLTIDDVTLTGNSVGGDGGGLEGGGGSITIITNSTISGNTAMSNAGGGLFSQGTVNLTNVTMSGNVATFGGGLNCQGSCILTNVTVTTNSASTDGDGIKSTGGGSISLKNSIVANNAAGQECSGTIMSLGNNLSSDGSCSLTGPGDKPDASPLFGPLQDNGGRTDTHELLAGSQAIDAGTNAGCPTTDQRGFFRPVNGICDMGAYEFTADASGLALVKRAFFSDGTPIPDASVIPNGLAFKFLIYINNRLGPGADVSVQDILDPAFVYQPNTIRFDNSTPNCALTTCTAAEESAIFTAANAGSIGTDAVDSDAASFATSTLDIGNQNVPNAQLDILAARVWAVVFAVKMQ
jgi:CSLREA domain-containing protein